MVSSSVAVIGAGIAGLSAAHTIASASADRAGSTTVTVFDADRRIGGRLHASAFAGVEAVDEGADAFLARVPHAVDLAVTVMGRDRLTHPQGVGASVWHHGLHDIPDGLILGLPGEMLPIARSGLLSPAGKLRAALEPLLPRTSLAPDSVGAFVRARFGNEVHERLVDALVGSIYATDTDDFSLAEVPQLHALAQSHRSMLLGARSTRRRTATAAAGTATAAAAPIFATPRSGVGALATATAAAVEALGGAIRTGTPVSGVAPAGARWQVDGEEYDAVVVATPALGASRLLTASAPEAAGLLGRAETADVIMVTLHIGAEEWPDRLVGRSGYLVPKPVQRTVTAVSFGSQKWAHWQPPSGGEILRVSLGRDGAPVLHLTDDEIVERVVDDLHRHLGVRFTPKEIRITRWPGAFAQYRPHHARWVDQVEAALPAGLFVTGASYRGIGVPACVRQGTTIGERAVQHVRSLAH